MSVANAHILAHNVSTLPPLATLQSWVHRPQAIAQCFICDIHGLKAIVEDDGDLRRGTREVFVLNKFPCKVVELVGWVAGVEHKETWLTVILDDGDGQNVIQVVVRLGQVKVSAPAPPSPPLRVSTFRSAEERKAARKAAAPTMPTLAPMKVYARPDIRVGDTVRVIGTVDEWIRRGNRDTAIRQVVVSEHSGSGSIAVVDAEEQWRHVAEVIALHESVYSQEFTMPATQQQPTPSVQECSPTSSASSTWPTSDSFDCYEEGDVGPELVDPSKLSSSHLTDEKFKLYLIDYMTREVIRTLRAATRPPVDLRAPIPALAAVFPEYRTATSKRLVREVDVFAPSHSANTQGGDAIGNTCSLPRSTFLSRKEREAKAISLSRGKSPDVTPTLESHPVMLEPFTVSSLLRVDKLRNLAERVVDNQARRDEKLRRRREKEGCPTARDLALVAARHEQRLTSGAYHLSAEARKQRMEKMTEWAIRQAAEAGGIVQVPWAHCDAMSKAPGKFIGPDENATPRASPRPMFNASVGYLPLPPDLLGPLLVPVAEAERSRRSTTFRPKSERLRPPVPLDAESIGSRLRQWGDEGRWERVADWAVAEAVEWAEAQGILALS